MSRKSSTDTARAKPLRERAFALAIQLENRGEFTAALTLLELLVKQYAEDWRVQYYIGGIYLHELDQPKKAIAFFRKAVDLKPKSERASLGLFHALWGAAREVEALDEIKRFQTIAHSDDYDRIVAELART